MDDIIDEVQYLRTTLKNERDKYEPVWDEIIEEIYPIRWGTWENKERRGERNDSGIYDSYPVQMANISSDGIQGHLVSDSFRWFTLSLTRRHTDPRIRRYLQDVEDQMYYEFQRSNFYEAINEYITDAQIIGTAHMYAQEAVSGDRIVFRCLNPYDVYIDENFDGSVDTHVREFYLTVKQAVEKFGFYHDAVKRFFDSKQYAHEIRFLHVIRPRSIASYGESPESRPFQSLYVDVDNNTVVSESGYNINPIATWRWRKLPHEKYGRGPAWDALRDIKVLNEMGKTLIGSAQRHVDPPWMIPAELKTEFDGRAGAVNYYMDPNRIPFQVTERSNFPVGQDREEQKRMAIRQAFNVDFFLMLQQSEREMTATEIIEKQNEKVAILGPMIGRLQSEGLNPLIDIVFDIANRAGRMPEVPAQLAEMYGGGTIDIDYTGPLAQAQKRLRMQGTQAALQTIAPYMQLDPTILDQVNLDVVARDIMESYGMRQEAIRTRQEVQAIREQRAQQMQAQQEAELQEAGARSNRDNAQAATMASQAAQVMRGR